MTRLLIGNGEHIRVLKTFDRCAIAGLFCTVVMCRVKAGDDVVTGMRLGGKRDERGQEVAAVLLIKIPQVEIKIHHQGRPGLR